MINYTAYICPPNSLFIIEDDNGGIIPEAMGGCIIANTESCVVVGCRSSDDGATRLTITSDKIINSEHELVFEGKIIFPSNILTVRNIFEDIYFSIRLEFIEVILKLWINHPHEPDDIIVQIEYLDIKED